MKNENLANSLPDAADIPEQFYEKTNEWHTFVERWFYAGLSSRMHEAMLPKIGVELRDAIKTVLDILHLVELPHRYRVACAAFLLSELVVLDGDAWMEEDRRYE